MKITGLNVYQVPLTSHETYYMADGKTCDTVETVVLRIDTDEGIVGWGEVCPIPHYLPAYARGVAPAIAELAGILMGADPMGPEALMTRCDAFLQGHRYAKSVIDMALWDITAKAAELPLYRLLGGGDRWKRHRCIIPSAAQTPRSWPASRRLPIKKAFVSFS